jgi:hypothetical protein
LGINAAAVGSPIIPPLSRVRGLVDKTQYRPPPAIASSTVTIIARVRKKVRVFIFNLPDSVMYKLLSGFHGLFKLKE